MKKVSSWDGKQYKENSSPQESSAMQLISSISFSGDEHVLDIGCGDGKITHKIREFIPHGKIIGIDTSDSMLEEARKHNKDNLFFYEKSAHDFSFNDRFDYVFSFHTLHWVKDKVQVFKNVRNHLKPTGKFIFITSGRGNETISNVFSSEKWKSIIEQNGQKYHSTDSDQIKSMISEAGLSAEKLEADYWSKFYSDKTDLIKWLMTWVPYATGLNKDDSMFFSEEIAENMLQESLRNGIKNGIEFKTEMLSIEAVIEKSR